MSRRRKIVFSIIGGLVVAIGGLVAAFVLSSPPAPELPIDVETKEIPLSWVDPGTSDNVEPADAEAETPAVPYVSTGKLAMVGDGKPFGEEAYELTISEEQATLTSSGRFWFKVVLATIHVTFEQTFEGEGDLTPVLYVAEFHAPLGFDRSVRATVEEDRVTVERSDDIEQIAIEPGKTFALGTFSSYVLLPRLFGLRAEDGSASFDVLVFGGPPNQQAGSDRSNEGLPGMTIERAGTASLRAGGILLDADCYLVSSGLGESELFARGDEFLALRAGTEDESLLVYRSDFFPNGIEIVDATP
jgi:hypothetical protein